MQAALDEVAIEEKFREPLWQFFTDVAYFLINTK